MRELPDDETADVLREFAGIADPQLIVLKGHALTEWALRRLLARRLSTQTLPRLPHWALVDLALAGLPHLEGLRDHLKLLAEVRNKYAHELRPKDAQVAIEKLVTAVTGRAYPGAEPKQLASLRNVVDTLLLAVLEAELNVRMSPDDWVALAEGLESRARETVERLQASGGQTD